MAYVITERCTSTKDASCTRVCPVECIHPTPDEPGYATAEQLYIDPEECIDCDACMEACPVDAIYPIKRLPTEYAGAAERNAEYYS
ncbi:4Fe-4S dicluster domain-containing protein [Nocardia nepalensis]|uniref:4Fe-4S dicluster domain-containing protein n=1 Tax=Nocardia nepalensis TaxID=3375448 RepID=UPI003B670672